MKADKAFGNLHSYLPAPQLQNHWIFGADRLEEIFRANGESRLMECLLSHFRHVGWTYKRVFLGTPAIRTADPANIAAILSSNFKDFGYGRRREMTFPLLGDGIFSQDGAAWKQSRELLRPQFHCREYADLEIFRDSCDNLLDNISASCGVVDLQPLFFRLTLDVTTAYLFGESVGSLKAEEKAREQTFEDAFNIAQEYISRRFKLPQLYWLSEGKEFRDACGKVHSFADEIINRNLSHKIVEGDRSKSFFLEAMAKKSPNETALRSQIINILIAGRDTAACLLSWVFFLLVRHPQVLEKLQDEISKLDSNAILTRSSLRDMNYLQNVLKGTLRLYPPVPFNERNALCATTLPTGGGPDGTSPVLIPKGSSVAYSVYAMHRRPDLYGMDAELFRPERWDEKLPMSQNEINSKWGYLPFNGGPRVCLGMDFALTEAAYTVVQIIQKFPTIKLPKGEHVELLGVEKQKITMVLSIKGGCNVELR
ncbi:hypothetical protein V502_02370 [Pseudogymnoascus sp. VKM F-4520 (FW-2644)]|nr:hypothetical protein V502_02370 [Pseudogymnoascus sp. VKM F-4520 (FW-2644)]